jgi:hypothetical protein
MSGYLQVLDNCFSDLIAFYDMVNFSDIETMPVVPGKVYA